MSNWFNNLSVTWQSLLIIGAIFTFAFTIAAVAVPLAELPGEVEKNAELIKENTERIEGVEHGQDETNGKLDYLICLLEADVQGSNPLECI